MIMANMYLELLSLPDDVWQYNTDNSVNPQEVGIDVCLANNDMHQVNAASSDSE